MGNCSIFKRVRHGSALRRQLGDSADGGLLLLIACKYIQKRSLTLYFLMQGLTLD